jgi:hypothetical protein
VKGAPEAMRDLFIYRVDKETSIYDIGNYIESQGFTVEDLQCVSHDAARFKSFKLTVPVSQYNSLFDSNLWAHGIRVRKYKSKQQSY